MQDAELGFGLSEVYNNDFALPMWHFKVVQERRILKKYVSFMGTSILSEWRNTFLQVTHLSGDALSIYSGLLLFFIAAFFHQRQLKSHYAIWTVIIAAVAMELFGARHDILDRGYWRIGASLRDMANMIFLPLLIWLMAKYRVWKG